MGARWRPTVRTARAVDAWITREFAVWGLSPPHCTPEALARALERERQITIVFQFHASADPGVYGLLYRPEASPHTYVIVLRSTHSLVLRRLTMFHELAHILFNHPLTDMGGMGLLRGYMVANADDAVAEAFAVGAMQYSFLDADAPQQRTAGEDDVSPSAFGQFLRKTEDWP
jgi:hypothetical protein